MRKEHAWLESSIKKYLDEVMASQQVLDTARAQIRQGPSHGRRSSSFAGRKYMADKIEGFLEVGVNDNDEVVVNHPGLKRDESGVAHIVFSPNQARNLASLLNKHAAAAVLSSINKAEIVRRAAAELIPVDRDCRELSSGDPVTPDHLEIDPATGLQKGYVVLCATERAKGFVRPLRYRYLHIGKRIDGMDYRVITPEMARRIQANGGCACHTSMSREIAETYARDPGFYVKTFCISCKQHLPLDQFVWLGSNETVGS